MVSEFRNHKTVEVLGEVLDERVRQDQKWGEQNHPNFRLQPLGTLRESLIQPFIESEYRIGSARHARKRCELAFAGGWGSYAHIAAEEIAEAFEETQDEAKLREELVQCAAVFVAWIECIDRRNGVTNASPE